MADKLRVGIVGCGGIAKAHVGGYKATEDVEIALVYDTVPAAAEALAGPTGARVAESLEAMANKAVVDAVSVCTPPAVHPDNCAPFLAAGVPVLCEKPLGVDSEAAASLADDVSRSGTLFMTAFCHRFHPPVLKLKELIGQGALGAPLLFRNIFGGFLDLAGNHRVDPALSGGGCLIDHCSHSVDLFRFLVGDPTHVQAMAGNVMQRLAIEDFGMMQLDLGGSAFGEITGSYSLPACGNWVEWYGTNGVAKVSYWNTGQPDLCYTVKESPGWQPVDVSSMPDRFAGEIGHFLACVRSGETPGVTAADGLAANRIVAGAYRSMREGCRVALLD